MLDITSNGENRLDITLSGMLNAETMKASLDDLIEKSSGISNGTMLYTVTELHMPSLSAIGVEMTRLPSLFRLVGQFDYVAVLTDISWLQKASEVKGALIPGLEIKSFTLDQSEEAEAWLASVSKKEQS
ncbi:STAS/SEC14 domain-containing protein [Leucothrix sargassi]|nr:STAS/SEC14 domain-containing protein [Leucothrix sargassi]